MLETLNVEIEQVILVVWGSWDGRFREQALSALLPHWPPTLTCLPS